VTGRWKSEHEHQFELRGWLHSGPLLQATIGDGFDRTVARFPTREALVDVPTGRRLTYAELRAEVDALAQALLVEGIARGDRVGIWAPNCAEWTIVQYATAKIGAILVTVNPAYRTHEVAAAGSPEGPRAGVWRARIPEDQEE
jgi:fatty-acyl-CoA synthase